MDNQSKKTLEEFITIAKKETSVELECKLLANKIQIKDTANHILSAIKTITVSETSENRATFSYTDGTRVSIVGPENIHKLCLTNSFKDIPLDVEKKQIYSEKSTIDVPDSDIRFTLRTEKHMRKDWEGSPSDPAAYLRILNRKQFKTPSGLFQIDFSMVKSRKAGSKTELKNVLKLQSLFELEIEFIGVKTKLKPAQIIEEFEIVINTLLCAYYQTNFLLKLSEISNYEQEFKMSQHSFNNAVTMMRHHLNPANKDNILKNYTVTNKADGLRAGLYVARDRKLLRVTSKPLTVTWTGITANDDSHVGDFVDGEYIESANLFAIFDMYRFKNKDIRTLPLMIDEQSNTKSRLGCAKTFVENLMSEFTTLPTLIPLRIESKLFLAGDGIAMEESIQTLLKTKFEYATDGLIFTPKTLGLRDLKGLVYKWKPASQNSIDFLLKILPDDFVDSVTESRAKKGELYVTKTAGDDIIYPRETLNGEYVTRKLPQDLQKVANMNTRIPAPFQPDNPRNPEALNIILPLSPGNIPLDSEGNKIEDNTIIECAYDTKTGRWSVMRTRNDKTYEYRVKKEPKFGNDVATANSIWTSMHIPITEEMISYCVSNPLDSYEDDAYYKDNLKRSMRVYNDVYNFHLRIKDNLYEKNISKDQTLLELGSGQAGDLSRWKKSHVSKVVAVDISEQNIISPTKGAAIRYLKDKQANPRDYIPPVLFVQGDMTVYPLFEQEDKYLQILTGSAVASTPYLAQFEKLNKFDVISCQFAMHYACESPELFRSFVKNIHKYLDSTGAFFGTCWDGKSVYSLLVGKKTHLFTDSSKNVAGEIVKQYVDSGWSATFGQKIQVTMESFDKPAVEYLVPFEKVVEIFEEEGFILAETHMFEEIYSEQTRVVLTPPQQSYSFLNRYFKFVHGKKEVPIEPTPAQEVEVPVKPKRKLKKGGTVEVEKPVIFNGHEENKGEYRNFSNSSLHEIEIEGVKYPTVEHYYQAQKATEFDPEMVDEIMKAKTGIGAKRAGKMVKHFNADVWNSKREQVMMKGVRAKFIQHPELRKQLLATGTRTIGKADARELFWGIGTGENSEKVNSVDKWRGMNKLGKIMMTMRQSFRDED